jgi:prolyl-tRNA synthetase
VVDGTSWITGADAPGKHVVGLVAGRDFTPDGHRGRRGPRRRSLAGRRGARWCARGIEIGHIFQLGRKYTDAFTADVLGEDGKPVRLTMGSYGVGVSRLVAVIAEQHHDELGLRWPASVAVRRARGDRQQGRRSSNGRNRIGRGWIAVVWTCCSTSAPPRLG